jgi:hypothetical protein
MVQMLQDEVQARKPAEAEPAALPAPAAEAKPAGKVIPFPQRWVERVTRALAR